MTIASTMIRHTGAMAADLQTASIQVLTDAASVGDLLVAVLFVADLSVVEGDAASGVSLPPGWVVRSVFSMVPTGDPRRLSGAFIVAEKKVTTAGTDTSVFTWSCVQWRPMKLYYTWCQLTDGALIGTHMQHVAAVTTIRFTGISTVQSVVLNKLANQAVVYPGSQFAYLVSGHAIVLGGVKQAKAAGSLLPALYHTERAKFGPLKYGGLNVPQTGVTSVEVATRDFTNVSALSDFAASAVGDGVGATILVANVVKPQVSWMTPGGTADLSKPLEVSWMTPTAGTQRGVAIYRESPPGSGSNIMWWNGTAWQAGSVLWTPKTDQSATLAGFAATAGTAYRFLLATWTTIAPDLSDYSVLDITHRPTPGAPTITLTPAPVSGKVASKVPTMAVSGATVTDGGSVLGYQVQWTDAATGDVLAERVTTGAWSNWALTSPLDNGRQVKARARFQQSGSQWSAWAETAVTINVPKPAAPAVTFQTVTHPVSGLPSAQLTVTAAAGVTVRVERGGQIIGDVVSAGPSVKVVDLASPAGLVSWTVTTLAATAFAERSLPTVISGAITAGESWLLDPTRPETAVFAKVAELDDLTTDLRSSVFAPIGDPWAIVQPGVPASPTGGVLFRTDDPAELVKLMSLLKSGAPLMLRGWVEDGGPAGSRQAEVMFQPVGEITEGRLTQGPFTYRTVQTGFVTALPVAAGLGTIT